MNLKTSGITPRTLLIHNTHLALTLEQKKEEEIDSNGSSVR